MAAAATARGWTEASSPGDPADFTVPWATVQYMRQTHRTDVYGPEGEQAANLFLRDDRSRIDLRAVEYIRGMKFLPITMTPCWLGIVAVTTTGDVVVDMLRFKKASFLFFALASAALMKWFRFELDLALVLWLLLATYFLPV